MGRCHITQGAGVPTSTPQGAGDHYTDTATGDVYISTGSSTPADWRRISETLTTLALNGNSLDYVDENGATTNIDLSLYIDDTNLSRLVSGTINPATGIATFTRDDASTFNIDFSSLIDIETVTTLAESPVGVFKYTSEDATQTTIDISNFETSTELDARDTANRSRINHTGTQLASTISDFAAQVAIDETDTTISLVGNTLRYIGEDGTNQDIDLSPYIDDTNLSRIISGSLNPTTGILTLTRDDASDFTVDLSALLDNQNASEVPVTPIGNISSTDVQAALEELQGDIDTLNTTNFGEDNTASNVGTAGVGTFKQKTGVDLEFKNINAGSNKISITDDVANNEIDVDVNEANLTITSSQVSDFNTSVQSAETDTTISLIGNTLRYIGENGANQDVDLSPYIDDTNLSRIISGSLNPTTGILTLTRDDTSDFTIDLSALKDTETITTLTESPTGVFTYTSEDATQTIIDISDFETSTELDARDTANRSRSNHTGTQLASTISDFDTEVSNNTDVAANTAARHTSGSDNQNLFETISVPNGTNPVADSQTDTLNFISSDSTVTITGNAATDTIDFTVVPANGGLETKAGSVAGASFFNASGQRVYDLTFATAFADADYSISLTSTVERVLTYTSKTAAGFRIETNSNTSISGESFDWVATKYGET